MTLREIRKEKGKTQEQIARLLGISLRYYQDIETGRSVPNINIGLKLAKILQVDPFLLWLYDYKEIS